MTAGNCGHDLLELWRIQKAVKYSFLLILPSFIILCGHILTTAWTLMFPCFPDQIEHMRHSNMQNQRHLLLKTTEWKCNLIPKQVVSICTFPRRS